MRDFDLDIRLDNSSWFTASQMGDHFIARHRCTLEEKKEIGEILSSLGKQLIEESNKRESNELS